MALHAAEQSSQNLLCMPHQHEAAVSKSCAGRDARCRVTAVQVQFIARGPSGKGRVSADMYQDEHKQWQYYYLLVDLDGGRGRINIVEPHHL